MINIAIDGYSSCGKSTIAKAVSKKYDMLYVDSGSMYRAITLFCLENNILINQDINLSLLSSSLSNIKISFHFNKVKGISETFLNGDNVEEKIRGFEVSNNVSLIAKIGLVRKKLVKLQRNIAFNKNVVMDGRDIGTYVIPDAEIKFFIIADIKLRAQRRYRDLVHIDDKITYNTVLENLIKRDESDSQRDISPLRQAEDSILIDTSDLNLNDQESLVFDYINRFINDES